jgi:hypothetical protein
MCGVLYCVLVLVMCVIVFNVFCIVSFMYVFLLVLSVLPLSDNTIAVINLIIIIIIIPTTDIL